MSYEPGTSDISTTMDPPFPPDKAWTNTIDCPYGWKIVITAPEERGGATSFALIHPWLGVISQGMYLR